MRKSGQDTRKLLLDAAERIVRQDGVTRLTLDAVVQESGISKGGILYHFSGKQALVQGMLERMFHTYQTLIDELFVAEPPGPGRWLRAYVRSALQIPDPDRDLTSALVAALATEPELLALFERELFRWQERCLDDGVPADVALIMMLAADGYWLNSLFNRQPPVNAKRRQQVLEKLLSLSHSPL